jgi:cell wall-associated NlpC family hydrolase
MGLDPRLHAFRPDLADRRLQGQVEAQRFAAGQAAHVVAGQASLRRAPAADAPQDSELLFGESVQVFDRRDGWAWVQAARDGYVGYVAAALLAEGDLAPSHQVAALRTFRFSRPDIKSPPLDHLSLGSPLAVTDEHSRFLQLADGGFVYAPHAEPAGVLHGDYVATAERFLAVPYLWGGRSALGLDCSGLVQTVLRLAGRPCPRDTYMQRDEAAVGREAPLDRPPERGDLLFSPGHVAIATGAETLLHANAYHLAVAHETLAGFRHRLKVTGQAIDRARRPATASSAGPAMAPHGVELRR